MSAVAVVLDWLVRSPHPGRGLALGADAPVQSVAWMLLAFSGAFAITAAFAVWTASSLGLSSFLLLSAMSPRRRWLRFAVYGIGAGVFIYLTNSALYLTTVGTPFRPSPVYDLDSHLKVFALSARAALSEETMFRLFAIPFIVSLGMRFYGWRPSFGFEGERSIPSRDRIRTPRRLITIALIVSALMFGLAHAHNPVSASLFGIVLGVSYLRGGWESAVTAHFLGNYLLFAGIYL